MLQTPGASLKELIVKFSVTGDSLAVAESDGRVKTFDTESGRLRTSFINDAPSSSAASGGPQGHLAENFTSMAWATVSAKGGSKSKKKTAASVTNLITLGNSAGDVKAFDLALGELKWTSQGCHEGAVTSLFFSPEGGLYTAGEDAKVHRLDLATGDVEDTLETGKAPVQAIAVSPDGSHLLAASGPITLWDLESGKKLKKFTGHSTGVTCLGFSPDGAWGLSGAAGERQVAVWDCSTGGKGSKKQQGAAGVLSLEDPPVSIHTAAGGAGKGAFDALAVSDSGEVYVWVCRSEEGRVAGGAAARVRVKGDKAAVAGAQEVILSAVLEPAGKGEPPRVLLARGMSSKPAFERVDAPVGGPGGKPAPVELEPLAGGLLLAGGSNGAAGGGKAAKASARAVDVLGAENAMDAVAVRGGLAGDAAPGGKKRGRDAAAGAAGAAGAGGAAGEETLGDKLAALGLLEPSPEVAKAGAAGGAGAGAGPVKADSLAVLLQQALQAEDKALLERCLAVGDEGMIGNTVRRLPAAEAGTFLRLAVQRLQSRPARGSSLAVWLKALLVHHTAYLMAAPGVQPVLTSLYQTIDARVGMLQPLMALSGRLDLLLAQLPKDGAAAGAGEDGAAGGAAAVYDDAGGDEGVVSVEDALLQGESDGEWETDSEGGSGEDDEDADGFSDDSEEMDED